MGSRNMSDILEIVDSGVFSGVKDPVQFVINCMVLMPRKFSEWLHGG